MTQTTTAKTCRSEARIGRAAAALATSPMHMTEANQLGPNRCLGCSVEDKQSAARPSHRLPMPGTVAAASPAAVVRGSTLVVIGWSPGWIGPGAGDVTAKASRTAGGAGIARPG